MSEKQPLISQTVPSQPPPSYEEALGSIDNIVAVNEPLPGQTGVTIGAPSAPPLSAAPAPFVPKARKTAKGLESDDPMLNVNAFELLRFFRNSCTRPTLAVEIVGSHEERRSRTVDKRESDGCVTSETEYYDETVVDFRMRCDLSEYVSHEGMIYTVPDKHGNFLTVEQLLNKYTESSNNLKSISLQKTPLWNFAELEKAIVSIVRARGYCRTVTVTFPAGNNIVAVHSSDSMSKMARNSCVRFLCVLSCFWIVCLPIYLCTKQTFDGALRADFPMTISEREWYNRNYWTIYNGVKCC